MRTVYLGTSDFAAVVLRRLAASEHRPALVVTRPDRPRGRGRKLAAPPVADAARELDLPLDQPESVNDDAARERIAAAAPEAVCVCAFGALIKEPLLSEHRMLNVHPSLLPRWRGAAPIERAIMAGDETTGVSIMEVTAGLDSGPVCLQAREAISSSDTYGTLSERLAALGGELLVRALDEDPACSAQAEDGVTYAEKIGPEDRRLDPTRPATELERVVRALAPHVGAFIEVGDVRLGVHEARAVDIADRGAGVGGADGAGGAGGAGGAADPPGTLSVVAGRPVLACADGALELLVVQPPGRRAVSGEDYVRGMHGRGG